MSNATFRDFDAAIAEERGEGLGQFLLGGRTFTIIPMPFEALATFGVLQQTALADPSALMKIVDFIAAGLADGEQDPFHAAVSAARPSIRMMLDIAGYVTELTTGRPTVPPSDSLLEVRPLSPSSTETSSPPEPVHSPG
jgi:hypothetical protein